MQQEYYGYTHQLTKDIITNLQKIQEAWLESSNDHDKELFANLCFSVILQHTKKKLKEITKGEEYVCK